MSDRDDNTTTTAPDANTVITDSPVIPSDDDALSERDDSAPTPTPSDVIDRARYEDIARRVLMQQSRSEIARAHNFTTRHLRRVLVEPEFIEVFEKARKALFDDIDQVIADEKTAPLIRARAQMIRSQTVVHEVMEEVRKRISGGRAKAADMRVAINAAFGMMDRSKGELGSERGAGSGGTNVNVLNVSATAREILRDTIGESGVDLSDVMPVAALPAKTDENSG
jgi:hypothetical protein